MERPSAPLVFIPDGASVESAVHALQRGGFPDALALHRAMGDLASIYSARARSGSTSASGHLPIIVATESSARGLHFDGVDTVFVLARPRSADEYLHLAGRTGRCGRTGRVVSILSYQEVDALKTWAALLRFDVSRVLDIDIE